MNLYMIKLGATPNGRLIEQHDVFFGIGESVADLIPHFERAWTQIKDIWHIDAYRVVSRVGGYQVRVIDKEAFVDNGLHLYFINMGGYKAGEFEEFHHKMLVVASDLAGAVSLAKQSAFYQEFDAGGRAVSHIDNKYGVDVDDAHKVSDVLNDEFKAKYALQIQPCDDDMADEFVIGYLPKKHFMA